MKVHEKNKKKEAKLAMSKLREGSYMESHSSIPFTIHPPHTCTSRSWLYDLFTLLGSIFDFAKYLVQVCHIIFLDMSST